MRSARCGCWGGCWPPDASTQPRAVVSSQLERRLYLPYSAGQLFDLVADIERYPEFVPGWREARAVRLSPERLEVEQRVAIGPTELWFTSEAYLVPPRMIRIRTADAPFGELSIEWTFDALGDAACAAVFRASYRLNARVLGLVAATALDRRLLRVVDAFEARARRLYGSPGRG